MSVDYFFHDSAGTIVVTGSCPEDAIGLQTMPNMTLRIGTANPTAQYFDIATQTLVDYTDEQRIARAADVPRGFAWEGAQWVDHRQLVDAKADKRSELKKKRDAAEFSTFEWNGYVFQCDRDSQLRLSTVAQDMTGSGPPAVDWILADNSLLSLNKGSIGQVIKAMRAHVQAQHDKYRTLCQQVDAATTNQQVDAVLW